jgi:hypothetical protein
LAASLEGTPSCGSPPRSRAPAPRADLRFGQGTRTPSTGQPPPLRSTTALKFPTPRRDAKVKEGTFPHAVHLTQPEHLTRPQCGLTRHCAAIPSPVWEPRGPVRARRCDLVLPCDLPSSSSTIKPSNGHGAPSKGVQTASGRASRLTPMYKQRTLRPLRQLRRRLAISGVVQPSRALCSHSQHSATIPTTIRRDARRCADKLVMHRRPAPPTPVLPPADGPSIWQGRPSKSKQAGHVNRYAARGSRRAPPACARDYDAGIRLSAPYLIVHSHCTSCCATLVTVLPWPIKG